MSISKKTFKIMGRSLMAEFKIGDLVKVKGSDVKMTVESIENELIHTVWFDTFNQLRRGSLHFLVLEVVDVMDLPLKRKSMAYDSHEREQYFWSLASNQPANCPSAFGQFPWFSSDRGDVCDSCPIHEECTTATKNVESKLWHRP
jgi:uncharacterized protein YodC (DUF2158 family)